MQKSSLGILTILAMVFSPLHVHASWDWKVYVQHALNSGAIWPSEMQDKLHVLAPTRNLLKYTTQEAVEYVDDDRLLVHLSSGSRQFTKKVIDNVINFVFAPINVPALRLDLSASDVAEILYHFDLAQIAYARKSVQEAELILIQKNEEDGIFTTPEEHFQLLSALLAYHAIKKAAMSHDDMKSPSFEGARAYMITVLVGLMNKIIGKATTKEGALQVARNVHNEYFSAPLEVDVGVDLFNESLENVFLTFLQATDQQVGTPGVLEMLDRELTMGAHEFVRAVKLEADEVASFERGAYITGAGTVLGLSLVIFPLSGINIDDSFIFGTVFGLVVGAFGKVFSEMWTTHLRGKIQSKAQALRTLALKKAFKIDLMPCELALKPRSEALIR